MTASSKDNASQAPTGWGVYTLGNDPVLEWLEVLFRSFRRNNATLPLTVIPYTKSLSKLERMAKKYGFEIMDESECSRFDALESVVMGYGKAAAMYRKWACFFGRYSEFIYLDADIAVTSSLDVILDAFTASPYDFVHFDLDVVSVYRPEARAEMAAKYGSLGFNAGAFVSRKGIITYDELIQFSRQAARDRNKFIIDQVDQPFLNYVMASSGKRVASIDKLVPAYAPCTFVVTPFTYDRKREEAICSDGRPMAFIHWPGCYYPTLMKPGIFLRYRTLGMPWLSRVGYYVLFYFRRYRAFFLKRKAHATKVLYQFFTSSAWRKFYLCKLVGVKIEMPS